MRGIFFFKSEGTQEEGSKVILREAGEVEKKKEIVVRVYNPAE